MNNLLNTLNNNLIQKLILFFKNDFMNEIIKNSNKNELIDSNNFIEIISNLSSSHPSSSSSSFISSSQNNNNSQKSYETIKIFFSLIINQSSQRELRDYIKIFQLPAGIRNQLVQLSLQVIIGENNGQLLLNDSIYIIDQISLNRYKVFHPNWNCFLIVQKSSLILSNNILQNLLFRCNQWISIGHHSNILPIFLYRRSESKNEVLCFSQCLENDKLTLKSFLFEQETKNKSFENNYNNGKGILSTRLIFHLMFSLCSGVQICHKKSLPHLNLHPDIIYLILKEQGNLNSNSIAKEEFCFDCMISSFCLSEVDRITGYFFEINIYISNHFFSLYYYFYYHL